MAGCKPSNPALPDTLALPPVAGLTSNGGWQVPGVNVAHFTGRVTLLGFWATWCSYCQDEHQALRNLAADGRFKLAGLAVKDDPAKVRDYLMQHGNPYSVISLDHRGTAGNALGKRGVPTKYLIGPNRAIVATFIGPVSDSRIMNDIRAGLQRLQST